MSKLEDRIAAAERRLKALKARHVRAATKQRARDARQKRRDDVRRRVLVGAVVLELVESGEIQVSQLAGWLRGRLEEEDALLFKDYWNRPGGLVAKSKGGVEGALAMGVASE